MTHALDPLTTQIRNEFAEMPGLSLTERQAARLWHVPPGEAEAALRQLVDAHFLARSDSGRYRRPSSV